MSTFALITAAHNESTVIERTIRSVLLQTLRPIKWIIVCDRCTDDTETVARSLASSVSWISILPLSGCDAKGYQNKVNAIRAGLELIKPLDWHYLGVLDADIELPQQYYSVILARMFDDEKIGIAGGVVLDPGVRQELVHRTSEVPGAVQVYRRSCLEAIGGLIGIPEGGEDAVACAMARQAGYKTILFTDLITTHLKPRSARAGGNLARAWHNGRRDAAIEYYMPYVVAKCTFRALREKRYVYYAAWVFGYLIYKVSGQRKRIPYDVATFIRKEQKELLRRSIQSFGFRRKVFKSV
jgi:cellulose synthase/poly-beta-1,6-N-acetylglucosamine synthase-like glycosyltransferase